MPPRDKGRSTRNSPSLDLNDEDAATRRSANEPKASRSDEKRAFLIRLERSRQSLFHGSD